MNIRQYIDSTYLKTADQAAISEKKNIVINKKFIVEAIENNFKLIMLRPEMVSWARMKVDIADSKVLVGTVIDFPFGSSSIDDKISQAKKAIRDGADELDFVIDYTAFKNGNTEKPKKEVLECTKLVLENNKAIKWIIETAALSDLQIAEISTLIKNVVVDNFDKIFYDKIFVKSSTGFYKTSNDQPNGATIDAIKIMVENSFPLPVKASGGIRNREEAIQMIELGARRIGTSSAKNII